MNVKFRVHIQSSCTLMLLLPELDAWHYSYSKFGITRFLCEKANHHQGCLTCVMLQKGLHGWLDQYPLQPFIVSSSISFRKKLVLLSPDETSRPRMKILRVGNRKTWYHETLCHCMCVLQVGSGMPPLGIFSFIWTALPFCLLFPAHNGSCFFATLSINPSVFAYRSLLCGDPVMHLRWDV